MDKRQFRPDISVSRVTNSPGEHFFGYYDKTPWSTSGQLLLAMQTTFHDRQPEADDRIKLGTIDCEGKRLFDSFATTTAWCWQQGTMLQWLPNRPDTVLYNDRRKDRFVGVVHELQTSYETEYERAIYALDPLGRYGIGLNFSRLATHRPGYGYEGLCDPHAHESAPDADGLWKIDLESGTATLLLSLAAIVAIDADDAMQGHTHWLNHAQINTDGSRIAVLHRWAPPGCPRQTRLLTVGPDGSDPRIVWSARHVSHYDWRNTNEILVWGGAPTRQNAFWSVSDSGSEPQLFGVNVLHEDGHCSYSPNGDWIVTDTYPNDDRLRKLMLVRTLDAHCIDIAAFYAPPSVDGPLRVDLHPRWNRDSTKLCIDSIHEGTRQMYVVDVGPVVATPCNPPVVP